MNNVCDTNNVGIFLYTADYNVIANNTCHKNQIGIFLDASNVNTVDNNTCNYNVDGISLHDSTSNTVINNTCNYNRIGIYITSSDANIVENNTLLGNEHDITEEFVAIDPVVLLLIVFAGIIMLGAGWRMVKLSRAGISEIWIGVSAIVKHHSGLFSWDFPKTE